MIWGENPLFLETAKGFPQLYRWDFVTCLRFGLRKGWEVDVHKVILRYFSLDLLSLQQKMWTQASPRWKTYQAEILHIWKTQVWYNIRTIIQFAFFGSRNQIPIAGAKVRYLLELSKCYLNTFSYPTYIQPYIHTCINTYIHTYIHTYIP